MGFAEYLSCHPSSQPSVENIDKNHVINTIEAIHYTLHTTHRKLTNQIARKRRTLNDVTNHSNLNKTKQNSFCHLHATKQLSSLTLNKSNNTQLIQNHITPNSINTNHLYKSSKSYFPHHSFKSLSIRKNSLFNNLFSRKVHVTTRNKPQLNTYTVPIKKRHRGPNRKKTENMSTPQETNTIATQTEETSNIGQGRKPLTDMEHFNPLPEINHENSPDYLKQLYRVFGENFIAEATRSDPQSKNLFQIIDEKNWDTLKFFSRYWHSLKSDLSTTPTGCILYNGKLFIPTQLRKFFMNSIHRNHPGQSGMMHLANLIWFPRIHREIVTLTQNCQPCIKIGKNLKPIIPKSKIANLPPLYEPNEEIQLDFAGPITDEQQKDSYILATVDRFSRYPHAKVYHNWDTDTAIEYLEKCIKFHGIPRNIRCDQAQAFKSRQFEIFVTTIILDLF